MQLFVHGVFIALFTFTDSLPRASAAVIKAVFDCCPQSWKERVNLRNYSPLIEHFVPPVTLMALKLRVFQVEILTFVKMKSDLYGIIDVRNN